MARFDPESVDLACLAARLNEAFPSEPIGAIIGRTQLRDEVSRTLSCSLLEAEQIVDTMVARGFLHEQQDASGMVHWQIRGGG